MPPMLLRDWRSFCRANTSATVLVERLLRECRIRIAYAPVPNFYLLKDDLLWTITSPSSTLPQSIVAY